MDARQRPAQRGGTIGIWSWRIAHDDGKVGPDGANLERLGGDVQWTPLSKMQFRWNNGGWGVWW